MRDESEDLDPEFVKRAGEKAVRLAHLILGWVPIVEYTEWDFEQMLRSAQRRAEPDDDEEFEAWLNSGYSPHTEGTPMTLDDVKKGLTRLMPVLETVARITPNQYDDAAVAFLKALLAASDEKLATIVSLTK